MTRPTSNLSAYAAGVSSRLAALTAGAEVETLVTLLTADYVADSSPATAGLKAYAAGASSRLRAFLEGGSEALEAMIAQQRAACRLLAA